MGNFNVKEFEVLKQKSIKIFNTFGSTMEGICAECKILGDIVSSDDSNLGLRWNNVGTSVNKQLENINETFDILMSMLDKYISDTVSNEEQVLKELDEFDKGLDRLTSKSEDLLNSLNAIKDISFSDSGTAVKFESSVKPINASLLSAAPALAARKISETNVISEIHNSLGSDVTSNVGTLALGEKLKVIDEKLR